MKKFTKNIAERILSSSYRVTKKGNCTCLQWGKSMSGDRYLYYLSWEDAADRVVWYEFNSSMNRVSDTGMTCISSDINLDGDDLFVTIEQLEKEKPEILAIADKILCRTSWQLSQPK